MGKLLFLFTVMAVLALTVAEKKKECEENAKYSDRANICIATCKNPYPNFCLTAPGYWSKGCKCVAGHVRQNETSSSYIAMESCPEAANCGENQIFEPCSNRPPLCSYPPERRYLHAYHSGLCERGCRCKDGYVLSQETGKCVPDDRC